MRIKNGRRLYWLSVKWRVGGPVSEYVSGKPNWLRKGYHLILIQYCNEACQDIRPVERSFGLRLVSTSGWLMPRSELSVLSKGFQEVGELKWLPNEAANLRCIDRRREHLTAVSAC